MRSLFIPLQLATDARGLEFITDLDPVIDKIARMALLESQGDSSDVIARQLSEHPDEDGIVVGDETRLRQIITNLARCVQLSFPLQYWVPSSRRRHMQQRVQVHAYRWKAHNRDTPGDPEQVASRLCLYALEQGRQRPTVAVFSWWWRGHGHHGNRCVYRYVRYCVASLCVCRASWVFRLLLSLHLEMSEKAEKAHGLSSKLLSQHDVIHSKPPPLEWIVVRIEVTDSGCGIRQKDMAQTKLFCACVPY